MKILNCMCFQCKTHRAKHGMYLQQRRKARRVLRGKLKYATQHNDFDVELPTKYKGLYAS